MKSVCVHIHPHSTIDEALNELQNLGLNLLYSSEDENGSKAIYGTINEDCNLSLNPHVILVAPFILPKIDWELQFKEHGLNYHDGYVHVDLKDFGCLMPLHNPIRLMPGPGFGDLSHPTTNLVLKLMSNFTQKKDVLDIGCGSGILSIAAVSMGAKSVFGIDIDEDAIEHSKMNSALNDMDHLVSFGKAFDYKINNSSLLILMNMIHTEQIEAFNSLKSTFHLPGDCLISGILKKDKKDYLEFTNSLKWQLVSEIEDGDWIAFHFTRP